MHQDVYKRQVAGNMLFIPSVESVKAGEKFTVDIYGDSMKNVNGLGALVFYDPVSYTHLNYKSVKIF